MGAKTPLTPDEIQSKLIELEAINLRLSDLRSREYLIMDGPKGKVQEEFHRSSSRFRGIYTGNRWGKMLANSEVVLTPTGWRRIDKVSVGDLVCTQNGTFVKVLGVFPQGKRECYKVVFDDGSESIAGDEHLWTVKTPSSRFVKGWKKKDGELSPNRAYQQWKTMTTKEIIDSFGSSPSPRRRCSIPVVDPVQFPARDVPIDPYVLGLLIGDGGFTLRSGVSFTTADCELKDSVGVKGRGHRYGYSVPGVRSALRDLGLLGHYSFEKFIPDLYKWNSISVRVEVLRGLMDTDGYICRRSGNLEFCSTSKKLVDDVLFIIQSLGGKGKISERTTSYSHKGEKRKGRLSYRIDFRVPGINPFRLKRKASLWGDKSFTKERIIVKIEPVGNLDSTCISVDHPSGLFVTNSFIVTHNTRMVAQEFYWMCTHKHPYRETPTRPVRLRACADGWKVGVERGLVPVFKEIVDPDDLMGGSWSDAYHQGDHTLTFKDGSTIEFMSYEIADTGRSAQKFAMVKLDGFWHDEQSPYTVWEENMARIIDLDGFAVNTLTPVLGSTWEYDGIYQRWQNGDPGFACWTGSTYDNTRLSKSVIDEVLGSIEDPLMRDIRLYGVWTNIAGAVYPEFDQARHVIPYDDRRVRESTRFIVIDPAPSKPTAVVWFGVDKDGRKFAYRELRVTGRISEIVDQIREAGKGDGPVHRILIDPNWDYEDKQFGTNVHREYEACGMILDKASDDKWGGIEQVRKALAFDKLHGTADFEVMESCPRLVWEFKHYRYQPKKPSDDLTYKPKTRDVDDDEVTCVRYFMMANPQFVGRRVEHAYRSNRIRVPRHNRILLRFTGVG